MSDTQGWWAVAAAALASGGAVHLIVQGVISAIAGAPKRERERNHDYREQRDRALIEADRERDYRLRLQDVAAQWRSAALGAGVTDLPPWPTWDDDDK